MLRSDASVAAFAACVGFACYLNSVICGFVFDDRLAIIDNADVQHGAPLADVWVNDFWGKSCLLYTSPSPRDKRQSRMPSSA